MANPCMLALELLGMLIGTGGWFCKLAATIMPQWLSQSPEMMSTESYETGLWEACVVQESAGSECRPYDTILGLQHMFTLARVLMCLSDATSLLGLLLAIPAMSQINCCKGEEGQRIKKGLKITAAVFLCIAGLLVLAPVSYVAHDIVQKFFDETVPHIVSRSEFGDALFVGWAAGFLDIVAAILLFISSCFSSRESEPHLMYHHQRQVIRTVDGSSRKRTEYV
ncbi:claudin-22-like [Xyrauchen texanus]|uniref:claudin-22-like n=1 Tax=Xyrauchen texanus TaxID=154827 RepID=UPI002241D7AF|nr:claudin-22-like [Xyrauchen texanus]XP_051997391.1 claudin-22-like [Xyrauchen texanus]